MRPEELAQRFTFVIPRTMRAVRTELRSAAKEEFTVIQFRVLAYLSLNSTGTNTELAEHLGTVAPMMSRIVHKLVTSGYVLRKHCPKDRRKAFLTLSKKGKQRFDVIHGLTRDRFSELFSKMDERKRADLDRGLRALEEIFQ